MNAHVATHRATRLAGIAWLVVAASCAYPRPARLTDGGSGNGTGGAAGAGVDGGAVGTGGGTGTGGAPVTGDAGPRDASMDRAADGDATTGAGGMTGAGGATGTGGATGAGGAHVACPYGINCSPTVLFAGDLATKTIVRVNPTSGATINSLGAAEALMYPSDLIAGRDGNLLVLDANFSGGANRILRYATATGAYLGLFANCDGTGGYCRGMTLGSDGNLYAITGAKIMRHDGLTGARLTDLAATRTTDLGDMFGIATGPDGLLYVTGSNAALTGGAIVRYRTDGTYLGIFATGGNANGPRKPVWDTAGNLYSANFNDGNVRKFDGVTGASLGVFATPPGAGADPLVFAGDGSLIVGCLNAKAIYRLNGTTGMSVNTFASASIQVLSLAGL